MFLTIPQHGYAPVVAQIVVSLNSARMCARDPLLGLILHPLDPRPNGLLIPQVPSVQRAERPLLRDGLHVVVQLVHQRRAGGDVQFGDDVLADAVQLLHQRAQRVAVGGDDDGLVLLELGDDVLFEVGGNALERRFETFRPFLREVLIGVP